MTDWSLTTLVIATFLAACVGLLSGIFGVGGGFLLVPALNAFLGVPMQVAVGSTACYTLGPATTALLARRPSAGFIELPLILAGGLMAGVISGTRTLTYLQHMKVIEVLGRRFAAVDLFVLGAYLVLMLLIATLALVDGVRSTSPAVPRRGLLTQFKLPPLAVIPDLRPAVYSIPLLTWTGLAVGFLSGFLGMSGGLVLVPAAIYLLGLRVHDATTMTIVIVWLVSAQSTLVHALHRHVHLPLVIVLLVSGALGAAVGSRIGMSLKGRQLKIGFGLLVLLAAAIVVLRLSIIGAGS